jgi:small-conductance mechanosensitive channel
MLEFIQTQKTLVTIVVFVATYFVSLTLGRLLKRRAGVPLGVLFQLFCLTLAFYAAMWFYGVKADWRNHVGAALFLLSTAFLVALVDRYYWGLYWERKRRATIPHFLRQVVALFIYLIALLLVLSVGYHAEAQLKGILAGSGIAAIVLGFATQDLFGGIIATWRTNSPRLWRSTGAPLGSEPTMGFISTSQTTKSPAMSSSISITRPKSTPCAFGSGSITTFRQIG